MSLRNLPLYPHARFALKCLAVVKDMRIINLVLNPYTDRNMRAIIGGIRQPASTDYLEVERLISSQIHVNGDQLFTNMLRYMAIAIAFDNNLKNGVKKDDALTTASLHAQAVMAQIIGCVDYKETRHFGHNYIDMPTAPVNLLFQFLDDFLKDIGETV